MCISTHQHSFNSFYNWLFLNNHNQPRKQCQTCACRSPETLQTHTNHYQIHSSISKGYTCSASEQVSACKDRRTFPAPRGYREEQEVYLHFTGLTLTSRTGSLVPWYQNKLMSRKHKIQEKWNVCELLYCSTLLRTHV